MIAGGFPLAAFPPDMVNATPESLAEHGVERDLIVSDNAIVNVYKIPAGKIIRKHVHDYSHFSYLLKGKVDLMLGDGRAKTLVAPCQVLVEANVMHTIMAIEDAEWHCVQTEKADA